MTSRDYLREFREHQGHAMTLLFTTAEAIEAFDHAATMPQEKFDAVLATIGDIDDRQRLVRIAYKLGLGGYLSGNPSRTKLAAKIVATIRAERGVL